MSWPDEVPPGPIDRWLGDLRRAVAWRRRLLTAGLLAGSVACGLQALAPAPPSSVPAVVATHDLAPGVPLQPHDVRAVRRPAGSLPAGSLATRQEAVGSPVASAVRRGEVLTDVRLVGRSSLRGLDHGQVAAPVRVADPQTAALLRAGDVVDVLAAATTPDAADGQARLVASGVRVLSVAPAPVAALDGGLSDSSLLLLATTSPTAARLASAAVTDRLSVVVRGQ